MYLSTEVSIVLTRLKKDPIKYLLIKLLDGVILVVVHSILKQMKQEQIDQSSGTNLVLMAASYQNTTYALSFERREHELPQ